MVYSDILEIRIDYCYLVESEFSHLLMSQRVSCSYHRQKFHSKINYHILKIV